MFQGVTPFGAALLVSAGAGSALLAALAALAWRRRPRAGAGPFAVMMALDGLWLFVVALQLLAPSPESAIRLFRLTQALVVFVPVVWIVFALSYADRADRLSPRVVGLLLAFPAAVAALTLSDRGFVVSGAAATSLGGVWGVSYAYGPIGRLSAVYAYALVVAGFVALFRLLLGSSRYHRRQVGLVVAAATLPAVANALSLAGVGPFSAFDPTPYAVAVEGVVLFVALFDSRLFDVAPVARAALVDTMADGVVVLDGEGRVVDINPAAAALAGARSDDGERRGGVDEGYVGADVDAVLPTIGAWLAADGDRGTVTLSGPDGPRHVDVQVTELSSGPVRPAGRLVVLRDATERVRREETLEALQTATRALMSAPTERAVCDTAVSAARDLLRLEYVAVYLLDERTGSLEPAAYTDGVSELYDPVPSFPVGEGLLGAAFEAGEALVYDDVRDAPELRDDETRLGGAIVVPLGRRGALAISTTGPVEFDDELVNFAELLAASVRAALARAERERELAARNERLDEFAGIVSHDLRNPLSIAAGYLDLLREERGGSPHLDRVEDALARIDDITTDMLALAREGDRASRREPLRLSTVAESAWETVVTGDARLDCALGDLTVTGDPGLVRQSFENLFRNAVEHGGSGTVVSVGPLADGTGFFVEDDGPGVPASRRGSVFDRGYSTDDGTGLGLAIVRDVVDAHGWRVRLADGARGGARFEIVTDGERTAGGATAAEPATRTRPRPASSPRRTASPRGRSRTPCGRPRWPRRRPRRAPAGSRGGRRSRRCGARRRWRASRR